jgi:hypothetical protein
MQTIYKFSWYCGRQGDIEGIFVADSEEVEAAIGIEVNFGEALGKHSEIHGVLEPKDFQILSQDESFVTQFVETIGDGTISGYNPLNYLLED